MGICIRGARILDASLDFIGDLYIDNGSIRLFGTDIQVEEDCQIIEGEGLVLLPSFIDLHAHFRDPGLTYKEDLLSGSQAAVKGGYTFVNLMANTKPVCSTMDIARDVRTRAAEIGLVDVHQTVSVTRDFSGADLSHIEELDATIRFLSEDGKGVEDHRIMLMAMQKAREKGYGIMSHTEYTDLNAYDTRLSENLMTARDIELSAYTGCHLHVCHVSTREAMNYVIEGKKRGANVTCEVTPHHIALANHAYRVNPPIRSEKDVEFLIHCMKEGLVDAIATDHAPHTTQDKANGAPGMTGLETAFSVCYTNLVETGHLTLQQLSHLMSKGPGELMGIRKGQFIPGFDGDVVLVNLAARQKVEADQLISKGKNTPFDGKVLSGEVVLTIKGGRIVYDGRK